jgi:DNA helicase-2/ATP-dependent DNA helicase PcrA
VDWKTDKTTDNAANHRRQLATYKKLYSIANNIEEKDIKTAICFIALRGKINTGKLDYMLDDQQPKPQQFETVLRHINNFAEYKKNPELFITKLLGQADQSFLHKITKQELS